MIDVTRFIVWMFRTDDVDRTDINSGVQKLVVCMDASRHVWLSLGALSGAFGALWGFEYASPLLPRNYVSLTVTLAQGRRQAP